MNHRHTQLRDALGRLKSTCLVCGVVINYGASYCDKSSCHVAALEAYCPDCGYSPCSCPDERTNEPERGPIFSF